MYCIQTAKAIIGHFSRLVTHAINLVFEPKRCYPILKGTCLREGRYRAGWGKFSIFGQYLALLEMVQDRPKVAMER